MHKPPNPENESDFQRQLLGCAARFGATLDDEEIGQTIESLIKKGKLVREKVEGQTFIRATGKVPTAFDSGMPQSEIETALAEMFVLMKAGGGFRFEDANKSRDYFMQEVAA